MKNPTLSQGGIHVLKLYYEKKSLIKLIVLLIYTEMYKEG